ISVFPASAMDRRHSSQPSFAMPSQSTATSMIGFVGPSRISPRAERGSTIFAAGFTPAEQQSGDPSGGVTSTLNVARRKGPGPQATPAQMKSNDELSKRIGLVISRNTDPMTRQANVRRRPETSLSGLAGGTPSPAFRRGLHRPQELPAFDELDCSRHKGPR